MKFAKNRGLVVTAFTLAITLFAYPAGPRSTVSLLRPYVPESPHKAFGVRLASGDLAHSKDLQEWVSLADHAILKPASVTLPFEFSGNLDTIDPWSKGFAFETGDGRRLKVELHLEDGSERSDFFLDLFRADGNIPEFLTSMPPPPTQGSVPGSREITFEPSGDEEYIVRVQPGSHERDGRFRLTISTEALLEFPVSGHGTSAIQSGFGAARDGGAREHHGVDIFANRGTPVVASVDARVTRVDTTSLGGKVVWLQPLFGNTRLYYAHLDSQEVEAGQYVFAGETIGAVGNTGNARTTPPHLHFGVYVRNRGGPRDPYPYLN